MKDIIRRGEASFVAIPLGQSHDPKDGEGLAAELGVDRATALGYYALWHELILEKGDALTGRIHDYTAGHIAAKLGYRGKPEKLVKALKTAGLLRSQRTTFIHPYWRQTITGQYAAAKAELRKWERERKQAQRAKSHAGAGDVPGVSQGQGGDVPPLSSGNPEIKQSTNGAAGAPPPNAPPPPPLAGGDTASLRWGWMLQNHPRPIKPEACTRYLGAIPAEEWPLCQWVAQHAPGLPPSRYGRKKRAFSADSYKFLADKLYLQFRQEWQEKLAQEKAQKDGVAAPGEPPPREPTADEVKAVRRDFLLAQLADADRTEEEKEKARQRWLRTYPDEVPPWEEGNNQAG